MSSEQATASALSLVLKTWQVNGKLGTPARDVRLGPQLLALTGRDDVVLAGELLQADGVLGRALDGAELLRRVRRVREDGAGTGVRAGATGQGQDAPRVVDLLEGREVGVALEAPVEGDGQRVRLHFARQAHAFVQRHAVHEAAAGALA